MAQSPMPRQSTAQQLQTPPNTLVPKKKERPASWEVDNDRRKKVSVVDGENILEGSTGPRSENTHIHITPLTSLSATISFCDADNCSIGDSISAGDEPMSANRGDIIANVISSDDLSPSDGPSRSVSSDHNNSVGDTAWPVVLSGQMLHATDSEVDSGAPTTLIGDHDNEEYIAGQAIYPQLPVPEHHRCADINEVASQDRSIATDLPNVTLDPFNSALDYIAFDPSSTYGDLHDDTTALEHISINGPRTEPRLCAEQLALVKLIMSGQNVFYTGSAGCGKSTVLKHIVSLLRKEGRKVDILAPTGRAALEINGRTLHSYAGWVPHSLAQPLRSLEDNARGKKVWKRLNATKVLIIDEISMVANHVFERLNCIMKSARDSKKPFGGVQIIVTGDFCQLPPVNGFRYCLICGTSLRPIPWESKYECVKCLAQFEEVDKWAFSSAAWEDCNFRHVNLKVIHRQKDADFMALLEKCRLGLPWSVEEKWLLLEHASETKDAVRLFPKRKDAKEINDRELAHLPGRALIYFCVDNFYWNPEHDTLGDKQDRGLGPMSHTLEALAEHSFESKLVLKEGMLVILLVNWDLGSSLANGSQGTIVGFEKHNPNLFPEVPRGREYFGRKNGLVRAFVERTAVKEWPIVQFLNGTTRTIYPRCMMNELGDEKPYSLLSRTQIPLTAAWAMTVHKAQGMTLSRVIVDLRHSFEPGQDYVALSRAETLEGLKVEGLPITGTGPNKQVIEFLKENDLMLAMYSDECNDAKSDQVKEIE